VACYLSYIKMIDDYLSTLLVLLLPMLDETKCSVGQFSLEKEGVGVGRGAGQMVHGSR